MGEQFRKLFEKNLNKNFIKNRALRGFWDGV